MGTDAFATQAISADPGCLMAHAFTGIWSLLHGAHSPRHPESITTLKTVTGLLSQGRNNRRETLMGVAFQALMAYQTRAAAACMEAILLEDPFDILALRIAQDLYIQLGYVPRGACGCARQ